jgi:hypothetical protein
MTGKRELMLTPDGRNTLSVRQFSDMSAFEYCKELFNSKSEERQEGLDLQAADIGGRNCGL